MTEQHEGTQPQYRDVTIEKGDWRPNDEETKKTTGIEGVFTTITNKRYDKRGRPLPDLIIKKCLHNNGRVTETIINSQTNQEIPQTATYEKINGRVEPHPKDPHHYVLKYQESLTPKPIIQLTQPKTS